VSHTAILNRLYAERHGYDYRFVHLNTSRSKLAHEYNHYQTQGQVVGHAAVHFQAHILHPGLQHIRGQSWGKLIAISQLCMKHKNDYDFIVYLDADIAINPKKQNLSLDDLLNKWNSEKSPLLNDSYVQWGQKNLSESAIIFLTNAPWRDDMPNAGLILVRPSLAEPLIRQWWDYDLPSKALDEFEEQDALWYMVLGGDKYNFLLNTKTASMVYEPVLRNDWMNIKDMWAVHFPNYESERLTHFRIMLFDAGHLNLPHLFKAHVQQIATDFTLSIDSLEGALDMFNRSLPTARLVDASGFKFSFPPFTLPPVWASQHIDDAIHRPESSPFWTLRQKWVLPSSLLLSGFIVRYEFDDPRNTWLIENERKRSFPNYLSFHLANYSMDLVLILNRKDSMRSTIPDGPPMPDLANGIGVYELTEHEKLDRESFENHVPLREYCAIKTQSRREIYLYYNGTKHIIPNWGTYLNLSPTFNGTTETLPAWLLDLIPLGDPVPSSRRRSRRLREHHTLRSKLLLPCFHDISKMFSDFLSYFYSKWKK